MEKRYITRSHYGYIVKYNPDKEKIKTPEPFFNKYKVLKRWQVIELYSQYVF